MKTIKFIFLSLLFLIAINSFGQITNQAISSIRIKSKVPLLVDTRTQIKDTVYVTIDKWIYDTRTSKYIASVVDYVQETNGQYREINKKLKAFSKVEISGLFNMLNNPISIGESYCDEIDVLLKEALLIDTTNNLLPDGKTIYGGLPENWQLDN